MDSSLGCAKLRGMSKKHPSQRGQSRTKRPERNQIEIRYLSLDQILDREHQARVVWKYVQSLDLSELYAQIRAVEGSAGRDAVDPAILLALWLYATLKGVTSARYLETLTKESLPYQWLCGKVSVNYHLLADFHAHHGDLLNRLLTDSISVLLHQGLVTLDEVAQDGMRVRASAGASSFRREPTLKEAQQQAREHLERLKREQAEDPSGDDRRRQAAQLRAASEREQRIEQALVELKELEAQRDLQRREPKSEARASTTDPEARKMKMANGGFNAAFNVQFASDSATRLIVGVDVNNQGSDAGLMAPMHAELEAHYGQIPDRYLVDGGFFKCDDVTVLEKAGTQVHSPLPREEKQLEQGKNPYAPKKRESAEMSRLRERMGTAEAKEIYKHRCSVAEFPNADCRNRGLQQFRVRGCVKAKAIALWYALAFNFMRFLNLGFMEKVIEG